MVDHSRQQPPRTPSRQERPDRREEQGGAERIAKALARAGVASRRDVERLISEGRVALNGQVLSSPAVRVEAGDLLTVDGNVVEAAEPTRLWRYHKPTGLVTTHKDPQGRPTVFEHLPPGMPRVISVGRLDLNSEGLLLLTNDGELARALEMPSSGWVRRYRARAYGHATQAKLDALKKGVTIEGVAYGPIEATLDKAKPTIEGEKGAANVWVSVALTEGKNREVRRVLEHLGLKVNRLIRLAYGPFALGTLPQGAVEEIGPRVIREQLAGLIAPQNLPKGDRRPAPMMMGAPSRRNPSPAKPAPAGDVPRQPGMSPSRARHLARQAEKAAEARALPSRKKKPAVEGEPQKKVYKAGWAKPKPKARPGPAKPKTRGGPKKA
jgi:23S rRNA pseudouridine2605 synthase